MAVVISIFLLTAILFITWVVINDNVSVLLEELIKHSYRSLFLIILAALPYCICLSYWARMLVQPKEWWQANLLLVVWAPVPIAMALLQWFRGAVILVLGCIQATCKRETLVVTQENKAAGV